MRPSSSIQPRDEDEENPLDPEPPSRKARKYVDRKAPKVNFLRKVSHIADGMTALAAGWAVWWGKVPPAHAVR